MECFPSSQQPVNAIKETHRSEDAIAQPCMMPFVVHAFKEYPPPGGEAVVCRW